MASPPHFDQHQVVQRATRQFWRYGYAGTSVQDLVEVTGINRASMYGTFGDKRGLFMRCIEQYTEEVSARRQALLDGPGPAPDCIQAYFEDLVESSTRDHQHLGCLLTNSALEIAPHDAEVKQRLNERLQGLEQAFEVLIARGQDEGDLPPSLDARQCARYLVSNIQGIRVMARLGSPSQTLWDIADTTLKTLAG